MAVTNSGNGYLGTPQNLIWGYAGSVTLQFLIGGTVRSSTSASGGSSNYTFPHEWANYLNNPSGTVTVRVMASGQVVDTGNMPIYIPVTPITSVTSPVVLGSATEAVKFTPTASSLKYGVLYQWGPYSAWSQGSSYIEPGSTSQYTDTGTVPATWAQYLFDADNATFNIHLVTYTRNNVEVGRVSRTAKFRVQSYSPTFTKTITEGTASGFSEYVQTLSTVKAEVTDFAMSYNQQGLGTIKTVSMTVDGETYVKNGDYYGTDVVTLTSNKLKTFGSKTVTITITDSRGRTATQTETITVYEYYSPVISNIETDVAGTTVTVSIDCNIAPVNDLNTKQIRVKRKNTKTGVITNVVDQSGNFVNLSDYQMTYTFTETVSDVDVVSYEYIVELKDSKSTTTLSKSTGVICISRLAGGLGVRFFAEAEEEGVWIRNIDYTISDSEFLELANRLADNYDTSISYAVGDYCLYNSTLYRCKTATTGTWASADWEVLA